MKHILSCAVAWCYRHPLTVILTLAFAVGLTAGALVEEKPVYQGDYWVRCGTNLPVLAKAYHYQNQFYYEVDGKRLQVKLSKCTITRPE